MSTDTKTYNGWTNYETWLWALWIDNDHGSYTYWRDRASELSDDIEEGDDDERHGAILELADELKSEAEENAPTGESGPYTDLLNAAMSEINWYEVAEHLFDE